MTAQIQTLEAIVKLARASGLPELAEEIDRAGRFPGRGDIAITVELRLSDLRALLAQYHEAYELLAMLGTQTVVPDPLAQARLVFCLSLLARAISAISGYVDEMCPHPFAFEGRHQVGGVICDLCGVRRPTDGGAS